ncbi:hypothetical protein A988_01516 [Pseudomonas syringae BRIP39023]|uniref:hypothetical protein n=1 Tax=Pseudomonas syringae TaxID=317 RepID=UPI0002A79A21|nr:hypothetical protein [Pseudomonas syringae]ELQ14737.1 hypothetical protein A988_01516 [Pseudomonas syringae BRIP39023]
MNSEQKITGDLFETDKRLALKPVRDFNMLVCDAFVEGPCTCIRSKSVSGNETGYDHQHTFEIDGQQFNRRFAITSGSDVLTALKKAWLSYTKADLDTSGDLELSTVEQFVDSGVRNRLIPLFMASGLVKHLDGKLQLQKQQDA